MLIRRLLPLLALVLGLVAPSSAAAPTPAGTPVADGRPNIVLVLLDDFSVELLSTMPKAQRMRRAGADFSNAYVVDSLCCPSRAATLTGLPPHLTGVLTNTSGRAGVPKGGYRAFRRHGNQRRTVNVSLHRRGYRTGFIGKFLNQYEPREFGGHLPMVPGWDDFEAVTPGGYAGWGFERSTRAGNRLVLHRVRRPSVHAPAAKKDRAYATNVIANRAVRLVRRYEQGEKPYFLYIAPFGPHARVGDAAWPNDPVFPPAFRDRARAGQQDGNCGLRTCSSLSVRDLPGFGDPPGDNRSTIVRADGSTVAAPSWRLRRRGMSAAAAVDLLRERARMVQSIDRLLTRIRRAVGPDTYVILTSDNGYHLGQHGLKGGKGMPYRSDVRVPLLVTGPDVVPGQRAVFTTNVDLAPTIEALAGARASGPRAGTSLAPALRRPGAGGAAYAFVEHTHGPVRRDEPDADAKSGGGLAAIPSYVAVRSARGLLVRLDLDHSARGTRYAWELYDYRSRSWEERNVFAAHRHDPWVRDLRRRLRAWVGCAPAECRRLTLAS